MVVQSAQFFVSTIGISFSVWLTSVRWELWDFYFDVNVNGIQTVLLTLETYERPSLNP